MLNRTLIVIVALLLASSIHAQEWEKLNNEVLNYLGSGDYQNALVVATKAKDIAKTEFGENHADYSASLHNLASAHKKLGEYTPAEGLYWEALKIDKQVLGVKHQNYALSLFGLANLYKLKKDFAKAESIYIDALEIMERAVSDRHPDYALILSDYGDLQTELQNYKKSENQLRKARDITKYSVGETHPDYASVLFNIGKLNKARGNISKAENILKESLTLYEGQLGKAHPDYKDCKRYLDNLYDPIYQLYKPAASEAIVSATTDISNTATVPDVDVSELTSEGPITTMPSDLPKTEMPVTEVPKTSIPSTEMPKTEMIKTEIPTTEMRNVEVERPVESRVVSEAPPVIEERPVISQPVSTPSTPKVKTWNDYSLEMDQHTLRGDHTRAIAVGETALKMIKKEQGENSENYTWVSLKLADSYENAGLLVKAIPLYEKDLTYIENTLGKENRTYKKRRDELLNAYKETGQKGKAQLFYKKSLYASFEKFENATMIEQNRMMESMQKELDDYYANSMKLGFLVSGTEMQNINLAFKGRDTDSALGITNTMTGSIDQYQKQLKDKLKPNEAAVDFLKLYNEKTNSRNYYALVTKKSGGESKLIPLLDENKINVLINAAADSPDSYIQNADRSYQLYQLVFEPLEDHLKGINFLHISTVGVLNKVAFSGLLDYQKNSLADKYEMYYYSSLRDFINDKSVYNKNESVSFFGGVDYGGGSNGRLAYLPATKDEVNTFKVVCAAKGWTVDTRIGGNASEGNLKTMQGDNAAGVLHLATPINFQHLEEFSGIALSNANAKITSSQFNEDTDDGLLNAREIAKMDLSKTNLVILSGTETGRDKNSDKGILAVQRALKNAGVDTILFSQWKVPDKQTQELLALFYINHTSGMSTHRAFYAAQKDIRKMYNSPYYWAGFILIE